VSSALPERVGSGGVTETPWIRSHAGGDTYVEMRRHGDWIEVRDGKSPDAAVLRFTSAEWAAWLDGAKKGEFDHLA
jgi:hypothetical protein